MTKKATTRILVYGAKGRMGQETTRLVQADSHLHLCETIDFRVTNSLQDKPDVIIDFSSPEGTALVAKWCLENKTPFVTGTTSLTALQQRDVERASQVVPVFSSPNMSVGLNAMAHSLAQFAQVFPGGEVAIEDIHHRHKKDAPSGTARLLYQTVQENIKPGAQVLDPVSIRGGEVFGIHKVYFFMDGEWVAFEHQALNRSIFARGAIKAATWLISQKPGYYGMKDLLRDAAK